ncbi:MAG: aminotransferase class V-fold PLP-dependent enzyme [Clostridia bacterium]|nr:aminotransferase class V-fold PLP-dependent enzyme [Clostridia bacterium]
MIYLDNAATTEVCREAKEALAAAVEVYGNPSSTHRAGAEASRLLARCRETVSDALGVRRGSGDALVFTASGTEANCTAVIGSYRSKKRKGDGSEWALIGDGEHPSVARAAASLEADGCRVATIPTAGGVLDTARLEDVLSECERSGGTVVLAAFMLVNNETGAIYDVASASSRVKRRFPDAVVHCDAVQGFGKIRFTPYSLGADTLSVSAHKIGAPRGAGALFVSAETLKRKNIAPILPGGGQEGGLRSGTENLVAIAAFAAAAEAEKNGFDKNRQTVAGLRKRLEDGVSGLASSGVAVKRPAVPSDAVMNLTLPGIKSETMLNYLSGRDICVSAGSACSAYSKKKSDALAAFGCTAAEIDSSIRVSLSHTNTEDEIDAFIAALADGVGALRRGGNRR